MAEFETNGPGARTNGTGNGLHHEEETTTESIERYRQKVGDFAESAQVWIQENPGYALLGAAAVGFLFARLVARRRA